MNVPVVSVIGAGLGLLGAAGIYFEPQESYKTHIVAAGTLRGALVALLTASFLTDGPGWPVAVGLGALFGLLFGAVVYLAKGGRASGDAPFILPMSILTGGLTGLLIIWLGT
jgi:hypothetical protein